MYIIAGLGNPGKQYEGSRHNVGFMTVDMLADKYNIEIKEKAHKALIGRGMIEGQKVILVKPQTYMNLSGESIRSVMDYYKVAPSEFIVVYDDVSLDPGNLRIRKKGSAGGHNGIKNIILHLGTQEFARVRVGVGAKPEWMDLADYVLGHFSRDEQPLMEQSFKDGAAAVVSMMTEGVDAAMNHFNGAARGESRERQVQVKADRAAKRRAAKQQGSAKAGAAETAGMQGTAGAAEAAGISGTAGAAGMSDAVTAAVPELELVTGTLKPQVEAMVAEALGIGKKEQDKEQK